MKVSRSILILTLLLSLCPSFTSGRQIQEVNGSIVARRQASSAESQEKPDERQTKPAQGQTKSGENQTRPAEGRGKSAESEGQVAGKGDVVRISVTLVQLDVTVTDEKGKQVTGLQKEDFEVLQNNRPQPITNFSYVSSASSPPASGQSGPVRAPAEPPSPPPRLKPEQVRRAIALVVDDLTLSFESTASVRQALKKFVDQQMAEGDLVAILRTGAGIGALQQFTNDRNQLYAAIERVRWKPGYSEVNTFAPVTSEVPQRFIDLKTGSAGADPNERQFDISGATNRESRYKDEAEAFRREVFAVGTLGALGFLVRGLRELPGRKSVILFSDALKIYNREDSVTRVKLALDNLTDLANRASVSFYTIDARGLQVRGMTAADDLAGTFDTGSSPVDHTDYSKSLATTETGRTERNREFFESQEGLRYLADKTGGFFSGNNNDLNRGVVQALKDQEGYYLLGFVPEESTFKSKGGSREFQDLAVRVKRPGLRVRTRTGFYGFTDEESRIRRTGTGKELLTALASPFGAQEIGVRLTTQFWQDPKGAFVNALLHIDARDIQFEETVNGWRKSTFEIVAFTFGDNGQVIDQSDRAYAVSMSEKDYLRTQESGIFYRINLPIKKPGAYQLRVAVRDRVSKRLGSGTQFVEIPDVRKDTLVLSGLMVRGVNPSDIAMQPAKLETAGEGRVEESNPEASPAVRRFRRGMILEYGYAIYNARLEKATGRPQLATRMRLFREGKPVYEGTVRPFEPGAQSDFKRLIGGGSLRLGSDLKPGEYALQVIVTDRAAGQKERLKSEWIDFDVIE